MQPFVRLCLALFFLELEMFQTEIFEKIKKKNCLRSVTFRLKVVPL